MDTKRPLVGGLESLGVVGRDGRCRYIDDGRNLCDDGSWRDCRGDLGLDCGDGNVCTAEHRLQRTEHDDGDGDEGDDGGLDTGVHGDSFVGTGPANRINEEVLDV